MNKFQSLATKGTETSFTFDRTGAETSLHRSCTLRGQLKYCRVPFQAAVCAVVKSTFHEARQGLAYQPLFALHIQRKYYIAAWRCSDLSSALLDGGMYLSSGSSPRRRRARCWSRRLAAKNAGPASGCSTWLMTIVLTGTPSTLSALANRALSATAMTVGMVTITNSVVSVFLNSCRASSIRSYIRTKTTAFEAFSL